MEFTPSFLKWLQTITSGHITFSQGNIAKGISSTFTDRYPNSKIHGTVGTFFVVTVVLISAGVEPWRILIAKRHLAAFGAMMSLCVTAKRLVF
jgi:hypothetical protein